LKELLKRVAGGIHSGAERYRKLSGAERIAYAVVAAVAVVAVFWLAGMGEAPDDRGAGDDGVEPGHRRAAAGVETVGADRATAEGSEWTNGGSILETPDRLDARLREFNRRKIEQAILYIPDVQSATIALSHARRSVLSRSRDDGDSAAVVLCLRRGVEALHTRETDGIREMVRGAFGIRSERISINDNRGNHYEALSEKDAEAEASTFHVQEKEDRWRTLIKEDIQQMYSRVFAPRDFYVGVIVSLSPQRSSIEKKEMDREKSFKLETKNEFERGADATSGGILSAADGPISVRESSTSVPCESYEKTLTDIPPGELKGVSVVVHLDLDAVERVEAARREIPGTRSGTDSSLAVIAPSDREALIKGYVARQEESLRSFLKVLGNTSVTVMVHPFVKPQPEATQVAAQRLGALEPAPIGSDVFAWLERSWRSIAAWLAIAFSAVVLFKALRRRRAVAGADEWANLSAGASGGAAAAAFREAAETEWQARRPQRFPDRLGVLRSVDDSGASVREHPEVAASVLRLWLAQEPEDAKEGAPRT
jgi:hypothetical protein